MLRNNTEVEDVRSHIDEAYEFLDANLPEQYVNIAMEIASNRELEVTKDIIRNVRRRNSTRTDVLAVLVEVARRNKHDLDFIKKTVKP